MILLLKKQRILWQRIPAVQRQKQRLAAHSCSAEAKAAAQAWLDAAGTDKEPEETARYIEELEADIMPVDNLIAFAESEMGAKVFGGEEAAKGVAWDKMQQLLQMSPWFMAHGKVSGRTNIKWEPDKRIELVIGSNNNTIIGRALFANFTDEINFAAMTTDVDKIKAKQKHLISQVDARMQSRFMKGTKLPTLNIIASSKTSDQSFLDSYISTKKKNESKTTLIIDEAQWVIRNDKGTADDDGAFYVAVGNKFLASEVLTQNTPESIVDSYRAKGYQMLKVPPGYYEAFLDNVELALTDIAGISTTSALKYISGVRLNEIKIDTYKNPFQKDVIEVGTGDDLQYSQFFDLNSVPNTLKSKPLYIHLDMSKSGDKTGIAGVWIMGKRFGSSNDSSSKETYYRAAFSVSVKAPKGREISFEKNRAFVRWLKSQGFNIKGVSFDTYQSAQLSQQLEADGFTVKVISVDRLDNIPGTNTKVCLPYAYFKSTIYEGRLELYRKCDLLTDEIVGLEKEPDGHINHPEGGTQGSKDQVDALCGATYFASQNVEQYSYDYGEDLDTVLNYNQITTNQNTIKKQVNIEFEKELQNMLVPKSIQNAINEDRKNNDSSTSSRPIVSGGMLIW